MQVDSECNVQGGLGPAKVQDTLGYQMLMLPVSLYKASANLTVSSPRARNIASSVSLPMWLASSDSFCCAPCGCTIGLSAIRVTWSVDINLRMNWLQTDR